MEETPVPGRPEPATLIVRVEGAFALELQHLAPIVVERVNAHYGWRCIGKIALRQAPVRQSRPKRPPIPALSAADRERIALAAQPIEEDRLRAALGRLGEAVLGSARAEPATKP